ncbi:MAG: shikimate kinase [Clostridiales bacterium]|nr:shikimate kinase [Clostridiales bacterium]
MMRCGLLGKNLSHSYSPMIHSLLGDYEYTLYERQEEDISALLREEDITGLNVTIPYKKTVIPYLDRLSPEAEKIQSVNTVVRLPDSTLFGDTTDVYGFTATLRRYEVDVKNKKVLVLGSGGAGAAVGAALDALGGEYTVISRKGEHNYGNMSLDAEIIINATPVGMYPDTEPAPVDLSAFPRCEWVLDLIYNPARTTLLCQAESLGMKNANGLYMLAAQAKRSSELFTSSALSDSIVDYVCRAVSLRNENIVLIGMPGCGKSSVGKALSDLSSRELIDSDEEIQKITGMSPEEIITSKGEEEFRHVEIEVLRRIGMLSGKIISTGGGAVTMEENYLSLHRNGYIVWLRRPVSLLSREGRPLSIGNLEELYRKRERMYQRFRDAEVSNTSVPGEAAEEILRIFMQNLLFNL